MVRRRRRDRWPRSLLRGEIERAFPRSDSGEECLIGGDSVFQWYLDPSMDKSFDHVFRFMGLCGVEYGAVLSRVSCAALVSTTTRRAWGVACFRQSSRAEPGFEVCRLDGRLSVHLVRRSTSVDVSRASRAAVRCRHARVWGIVMVRVGRDGSSGVKVDPVQSVGTWRVCRPSLRERLDVTDWRGTADPRRRRGRDQRQVIGRSCCGPGG
jgi:hypothetical protein